MRGMLLYFLLAVDISLAVPLSRDVYRLPSSALEELSNRGTIILEAASKNALLMLDEVLRKQNFHWKECSQCPTCLFKNCSNKTAQCAVGAMPPSEPSCDSILKAQLLEPESMRNWELSKACWYYRAYCHQEGDLKQNCLGKMQEYCRMRILQCTGTNSLKSQNSQLVSETKSICGQRVPTSNDTVAMGKIVGGNVAAPGSWPWLVLLELNGNVMCGGVLVKESWVITAAHCFTGNRNENYWRVIIGKYDLRKQDPEERIFQINRIITHPKPNTLSFIQKTNKKVIFCHDTQGAGRTQQAMQHLWEKFNERTFNNDIALLELTAPVAISEHLNFVCLPENIEELPAGTMCYIAGWGSIYEDGPSADVLIEARVPLLAQSTCKTALGKDLITTQMFCAGYLTGNVDSCQGDSGGPLTCVDPASKKYYLYGITSWGDGCGQRGKPGVYTRVPSLINWINSEMKKSPGSREPTCFDFHKLSLMQDEQRKTEIAQLCAYYSRLCPPLLEASAYSQCIEESCKTRMKKCEIRTFLQNLLDLLQPVEDFIRSKVDFSFFTQTIPKFFEETYTNMFPSKEFLSMYEREQVQMTALKEERHEQSLNSVLGLKAPQNINNRTVEMRAIEAEILFKDIGPDLDSWINYFAEITEETQPVTLNAKERERRSLVQTERQLLFQSSNLQLESLKTQLYTLLQGLRNKPEIDELLAHMLEMSHETERSSLASMKQNGLNTSKGNLKVKKRDVSNILSEPGNSLKAHGCQSVNETLLNISILMDEYKWILDIPTEELSMTFKEVLVDTSSKNEKGLFKARVKALIGGRPATFHSLVGLENDSFYRSMAQIIALALDSLKT